MNQYRYKVVEYYKDWPNGTPNRIVASAATLKGCLNQYKRHLETFQLARVDHRPIKTLFYRDDVSFPLESIQ